MNELEDLHADQTYIYFLPLEAKDNRWDPVKLA